VLGLYGVLFFLFISLVVFSGPWIFAHLDLGSQGAPDTGAVVEEPGRGVREMLRSDLPGVLGPLTLELLEDVTSFTWEREGRAYHLETTLDPGLQAYITGLLGRSLTHQAAVVVMSPSDGRILAMASHSDGDLNPVENLCIRGDFPAASIIKIVAAAAAIEAKGFTADKVLNYRGRRYTLYRNQLENMIDKGPYIHEISFQRAFSSSINPVFGKIGIFFLGEKLLNDYARKFLFNEPIPMELPLMPSRLTIPSDEFGLAEIASGFNKDTLISPVHACMITSAVANRGTMMAPWMIKRVRDVEGNPVYTAGIEALARPIEETTALELMGLMEDTMVHGTASASFRTLRNKKAFKEFALGGKTGSINDREGKYRLDWLSAFAIPRDGRRPVSLTVLAVHGEKLGIRSRTLARHILEHHYGS
jgi:penicillin-binding protein A